MGPNDGYTLFYENIWLRVQPCCFLFLKRFFTNLSSPPTLLKNMFKKRFCSGQGIHAGKQGIHALRAPCGKLRLCANQTVLEI